MFWREYDRDDRQRCNDDRDRANDQRTPCSVSGPTAQPGRFWYTERQFLFGHFVVWGAVLNRRHRTGHASRCDNAPDWWGPERCHEGVNAELSVDCPAIVGPPVLEDLEALRIIAT